VVVQREIVAAVEEAGTAPRPEFFRLSACARVNLGKPVDVTSRKSSDRIETQERRKDKKPALSALMN
jgi:hypothetical protein